MKSDSFLGPHEPAPVSVAFNDCVEPPCNLLRGTNGTTTITFKATSDSDIFRAKVRGSFFGIGVDHDLGDQGENSCKYLLSGSCPLEKGKQYVFQIVDLVKPNQIKISGVSLTYKLLDENEDVITCFMLQSNVVDEGDDDDDSDEFDDDDDEF